MTTPAINIDSIELTPFTLRVIQMLANGTVVGDSTSNRTCFGPAHRNLRAASVLSPIREDGTRAPRAWDRRWGEARASAHRFTWYSNVSGGRFRKFEATCPIVTLGNGLDSLLRNAEAGWSRRNSPTSFPYDAEALARTKFLNKLADRKMEFGETLAELGNTVSMVSDLGRGIASFLTGTAKAVRRPRTFVVDTLRRASREARRIKRIGVRKWARSKAERQIIDRWLVYQFGIRPLLQDIQSAIEVLSALVGDGKEHTDIVRIRAGGTVVSRGSFTWSPELSPSWIATTEYETTTSCHISCLYAVKFSPTPSVASMGLNNPLALAWGLTRFTVITDYFFDVGGWLWSLTPGEDSTFQEGSISRIQRTKPRGRTSVKAGAGTRTVYPMYGTVSFDAGRFKREVLNGPVLPALRPAWRDGLNLTQFANTLAVLTKILRS